jgi:hypothetical protein
MAGIAHDEVRVQLLPWRPRARIVWFWTRGIRLLYRVIFAIRDWFAARFTGRWNRWLGLVLLLFVFYWAYLIGVMLVAEVTIVPLSLSLYAIMLEWLALILLFPIVSVLRALARIALRRPWPTIPRHRSRRIIWP